VGCRFGEAEDVVSGGSDKDCDGGGGDWVVAAVHMMTFVMPV